MTGALIQGGAAPDPVLAGTNSSWMTVLARIRIGGKPYTMTISSQVNSRYTTLT